MTRSPPPGPRCSFRNIPPAIHVALGLGVAGSLTVAAAMLLAAGELHERFLASERWFLLNIACHAASTILFALGLLELARRHVGAPRALTQVAAALSLANLTWLVIPPLIAAFDPRGDHLVLVYEWIGRGVGASMLVAVVLITIAADAWRRAPIAAAVLVALGVTDYGIPVIGPAITDLVGLEPGPRQVYGLGRLGLHVVATLFVVAALAAGGRDPAPDPRAAAASLRLARGMLILRLMAAITVTAFLLFDRSRAAALVVGIGGPAIAVITMLVFGIAIQRVASARTADLPRLLLSLGAALTLAWAALQLQQATAALGALKDAYEADRATKIAQWYSISGPVVATLGLALIGSAIASFAGRRGDLELRAFATNRTVTFVVATLAGVGLQSLLPRATSVGSALAMGVFAATAAIVGLVALAGLLDRAARSIEATPGLPPARVV